MYKRKMTVKQKAAKKKREREHALQIGQPSIHNDHFEKHEVLKPSK